MKLIVEKNEIIEYNKCVKTLYLATYIIKVQLVLLIT